MKKEEVKEMTFKEWLEYQYYEGFDPSGLTDIEFAELEDDYREQTGKEPA